MISHCGPLSIATNISPYTWPFNTGAEWQQSAGAETCSRLLIGNWNRCVLFVLNLSLKLCCDWNKPDCLHDAVLWSRDAGSAPTLLARSTRRRMLNSCWSTRVCVEYASSWKWTLPLTLETVGSGATLPVWGSWRCAWTSSRGASTASSHPADSWIPRTPTCIAFCETSTGTYWTSFHWAKRCTWVETRYWVRYSSAAIDCVGWIRCEASRLGLSSRLVMQTALVSPP